MSNIFDAAWTTLPLFTTTTIKATGSTVLAAAPGAGKSICLIMVGGNNQTNTTGFAELSLQEGSGALRFREYSQSLGTHFLDRNFLDTPWILDTNTALNLVCSLTAASSPGAEITVQYRILDRTK